MGRLLPEMNTMNQTNWPIRWLSPCLFQLAAACSDAAPQAPLDGASGSGNCPVGTERCPCNNGSCRDGLECRSEVCVESTTPDPTGSDPPAVVDPSPAEPSNTAPEPEPEPDAPASGGAPPQPNPIGGTPNTGGAGGTPTNEPGGGQGGVAPTCGDTSNDWENCGACGRVCDNGGEYCPTELATGELQCCVAGQCAPSWGPCITESDFVTCDQACTSLGEICVTQGCTFGDGQFTDLGWSAVVADQCAPIRRIDRTSVGTCDEPIDWDGTVFRRCCCTDTQ